LSTETMSAVSSKIQTAFREFFFFELPPNYDPPFLPNWKRIFTAGGLTFAVVVGLSVGLGVGLGTKPGSHNQTLGAKPGSGAVSTDGTTILGLSNHLTSAKILANCHSTGCY
jgi:hypothetical protein